MLSRYSLTIWAYCSMNMTTEDYISNVIDVCFCSTLPPSLPQLRSETTFSVTVDIILNFFTGYVQRQFVLPTIVTWIHMQV